MQYQISKNYVETLKTLPANNKIVILNDPSTAYTSPMTIAQSTKLKFSELTKASDFPWIWLTTGPDVEPTNSVVEATRLSPTKVEIYQSCGFQLLGVPANLSSNGAHEYNIGRGHKVKFSVNGPSSQQQNLLNFESSNSAVIILYFDPQTHAVVAL